MSCVKAALLAMCAISSAAAVSLRSAGAGADAPGRRLLQNGAAQMPVVDPAHPYGPWMPNPFSPDQPYVPIDGADSDNPCPNGPCMTPYGPYVPYHPHNPRSYPFCDLVRIPYLCADHPVLPLHPLGPGPVMPNARGDAYDGEPQLGASPFLPVAPGVIDPVVPPFGGDVDEHGCKASTGYSWCESTQRCAFVGTCPGDTTVGSAGSAADGDSSREDMAMDSEMLGGSAGMTLKGLSWPWDSGKGKGCGHWMFYKSCKTNMDCCPSSGWNCGKDKKCGIFHVDDIISCSQYTKIAEKLSGLIAGKGCSYVEKEQCAKAAGTTACELAGLGPDNPAGSICAKAVDSAVAWGCSELCNYVAKDAVPLILKKISNC